MDRIDINADDREVPHEVRFSTEQYHRIADSGALDAYAKTELHDGRIVVVNAQYVPHGRVKTEIAFLLRDALRDAGSGLALLVETDVEVADGEVLQPDVTVYEPVAAEKGLPVTHVRLIVEVSASTEAVDLGRKRLRYATAGVPEYWVALLATSRFERFAEPVDGDYRRHDSFAFDAGCAALTLPGIAIPPATIRA